MTDQVSIPAASQGTPAASATTAKAQAGGKGSGFLGMLMAAIGHKSEDTTGLASGLVHTGKNAKKSSGKGLLLLDTAGKGKKDSLAKALGKPGQVASLIDTTGKGKKHAAASKPGAVASLIDATAQTAADGKSAATAHLATADKASAQSSSDQGSAKKHAEHKHRDKEKSPSLGTAPIAVAVQQATPLSRAAASSDAASGQQDSGSQHAGSKPAKGTALNDGKWQPVLSSEGKTNKAAEQSQASSQQAVEKTSDKPQASDASALLATQEKHTTAPATTEAMLANTSGQPITNTQGRQAKTRGTIADAAKASSQNGEAQTNAAAAQQAKNAIAGITGAHGMAQTHTNADAHPGDADTHPGMSHASDTQEAQKGQNAKTTLASAPKPGIHSYARVAAHTLAQAAPTTALSHQTLPIASTHRDAATDQASAPGQASMPGQDAGMGAASLTTAPAGVGQSAQAMPTPQMTAPQAPVHASGPWTAMAAMTEIGQAAATGLTRLELKLEPAHLGKVHVRIDSDHNKNIQVHLVVEQPNSCQTIQQQLPNLRHALEQQGLNLGNFSMSSQGQGSGQGSGQPGQQPSAPSAPTINVPQAQAPQISNTPTELPVSGRLSIRI